MASNRRVPAAGAHRRRILALIGAACVAAPTLARAAAPAARVRTITIREMAFGPVSGPLRVGDVVEWVNADIFRHTATAKDGSFDVDLAPKARGRITLKKAGTVAFSCRYHPGMTGRLVVAAR